VPVREPYSLGGKRVHVRRRNFAALGIVNLHVPISQVVGQDDEEVGTLRGRERRVAQNECQKAIQE
jgi:hypothetical protein